MNRDDEPKSFQQLESNDKDLVMFTITDLRLEKRKEQVHMVINLKRKIQTELLTTYLPVTCVACNNNNREVFYLGWYISCMQAKAFDCSS